jgi:hypothetical protein
MSNELTNRDQEPLTGSSQKVIRRRLEPTRIYPFHRSNRVQTLSVYWIGGFSFPMPFRVQQWFIAFLDLLKAALAERGLRQENFLRFRIVIRQQTERFIETSRDYEPLAGYAIAPDGKPKKPPTKEDIENAVKNGGFRMEDWVDDYTYWFSKKQDERQRRDFFGIGGMILLWLKPDPDTKPPKIDIPPPAQAYLDEHGHDLGAVLDGLYALQDGFLAKSKEVFGQALVDHPSYRGIPFVLPLLQARHFMEASPETLTTWFRVFDGYLIESREDGGVLLAIADVNFDATLYSILEKLRNEGIEWPYDNRNAK